MSESMHDSVEPLKGNVHGLANETEERIVAALAAIDETAVWALIADLHYADIADLVERSGTQSLLLLVPLTRVDLLKKRFNVRLLDSTMELEGDATALILVE